MSSVKGVSHLSRRAKRRLYCKLQLWMWRKRREKCFFRGKKQATGGRSSSCLTFKTQSQKTKMKVPAYYTPNIQNSQVSSADVSPLGCCSVGSGETLATQGCFLKPCDSYAETHLTLSSLVTQTHFPMGTTRQTKPTAMAPSQGTEASLHLSERGHFSEVSLTVNPVLNTDVDAFGLTTHFRKQQTMIPVQRRAVNDTAGQHMTSSQDPPTNTDPDEKITSRKTMTPQSDVALNALTKDIHGEYSLPFFF